MFRNALNFLRTSRDRALIGFAGLLTGLALTAAVAQGIILTVQSGTNTGPSITGLADPTTGIYFGAAALSNRMGFSGHIESGTKAAAGSVPTATICGAQPDAGSTDVAGTITNVGTTTCTLTFGTAYNAAPTCIVLDQTTNRATLVTAISASAIAISGGTAADRYSWFCMGKTGG